MAKVKCSRKASVWFNKPRHYNGSQRQIEETEFYSLALTAVSCQFMESRDSGDVIAGKRLAPLLHYKLDDNRGCRYPPTFSELNLFFISY